MVTKYHYRSNNFSYKGQSKIKTKRDLTIQRKRLQTHNKQCKRTMRSFEVSNAGIVKKYTSTQDCYITNYIDNANKSKQINTSAQDKATLKKLKINKNNNMRISSI